MASRAASSIDSAQPGKLSVMFGIDTRSLALGRVCVAMVLLVNLATRARDLTVLYSDAGMVPRQVVREFFDGSWRWSLHWLGGSTQFQLALFCMAFALAVALLLGFYTRLAAFGSWLLLVSLHTRMPMLVGGGDVLLSLLLLWGVFLPLGAHFSVDAWRRGKQVPAARYSSFASAAVLLQVALMYFLTGLEKWNDVWLQGVALQHALGQDFIVRPLGVFLRDQPDLLRLLTWSTLAWELIGPFLLLLPWGTRWLRPAALTIYAGMHLGIELTMQVTIFSYVCLAALTFFLPPAFWQAPLVRRFMARFGLPPEIGKPGESSIMATPTRRSTSRFNQIVCALLLGYILIYDIGLHVLGERLYRVVPRQADRVADLLVLWRRWNMFSRPPHDNARFVALARLRDGSVVDVLHRGALVDLQQPGEIPYDFPTHRQLLLFWKLTEAEYEPFRPAVADYLYRSWNAAHGADRQIEVLDLLVLNAAASQSTTGIQADASQAAASGSPAMLLLARVDALARGPYYRGRQHGTWTYYHENGQKAAQGDFRHGRKHGLWTSWSASGQKESEGNYELGKMHGRWTFWYDDGQVRQMLYRDDQLIGPSSAGADVSLWSEATH